MRPEGSILFWQSVAATTTLSKIDATLTSKSWGKYSSNNTPRWHSLKKMDLVTYLGFFQKWSQSRWSRGLNHNLTSALQF
jgi:hypothetical protein